MIERAINDDERFRAGGTAIFDQQAPAGIRAPHGSATLKCVGGPGWTIGSHVMRGPSYTGLNFAFGGDPAADFADSWHGANVAFADGHVE